MAIIMKRSGICIHQLASRGNASRSSYIVRKTNHLTAADEWLPLLPDVPRLYSMKWCPYAQRTRLALAHKRIQHEVVNINLQNKPSWLLTKNPKGAVPLIERGNEKEAEIVIGSLECCEWLENAYPGSPPLFPNNPESLAKGKAALQHFSEANAIISAYVQDKLELAESGTSAWETKRSLLDKRVLDSLTFLEEFLSASAYVAGSALTMTDFLLWPSFERLLAKGFQFPDHHQNPYLERWLDKMSAEPAVIDVRNTAAEWQKYWEGQKAGVVKYDL